MAGYEGVLRSESASKAILQSIRSRPESGGRQTQGPLAGTIESASSYDYAGAGALGGAIVRFTDSDGMPVQIAAGNQDPIVSAENSRELVAPLRRAGAEVTFHAVFDYLETFYTVNAYQFSLAISARKTS